MKKGELLETASTIYRVEAQIGGGGAGIVYRVTDEGGRMWAAKVLNPARATRSNRKRFKNEIAFAQNAGHPNIVALVDHGLTTVAGETTPFYVMACYAGSLKALIAKGTPVPNALSLFTKALDGVEAAHLMGAVHRDLKPANIVYDTDVSSLLIADFGIARFSEDLLATLVETQPDERLANFEYAAPEQRRPGGVIDHRADIFALGLILYEMLMGDVPHGVGVPAISTVHPDLAFLDPLLESMRAQSPGARPQTIADVKQRLQIAGGIEATKQRLNSTLTKVIPAGDIDDPLVVEPIRIESVTFDEGRLVFVFQKQATPRWFSVFQRVNFGSATGGTPGEFRFHANAISVAVQNERTVKIMMDQAQRWVGLANDDYRRVIERELRQREDDARKALEVVRAQEEQRLRMLRAIESAG